jgi:hypothetical protein
MNTIDYAGLGIDTALMKSGQPMPMQRQTVALFVFDKWEIDSAASLKLDRVIDYLESHTDYKLVIQGHSDLVGNLSHAGTSAGPGQKPCTNIC